MSQQVNILQLSEVDFNKRTRNRKILRTVFALTIFSFLIILAFFQFFPFLLELVTSFHGQGYIREYGILYFWPRQITFQNYIDVFRVAGIPRAFLNSVIHTFAFTTISLIIAFIFGYVLGKIKFRGRNIIFFAILSTLMVPGEVLMVPNFILLRQTVIFYDNILGIILPGAVNVFGIFLFKQFMNTIPNELLESAEIDGAGELTKIFRIVFPMCMPIIVTYIIITFTASWNEYLWPMIVLRNPDWHTLQLAMNDLYPRFGGHVDEYIRSAGMILISLPIILLFVTLQKYFLQSVNVSGMK
ncbi:MAG: carbohydrate ABC transporter permease [Firmicutes bacterium]|nr:carbohydrate ABC transporter permease [Bacillota bacterium]